LKEIIVIREDSGVEIAVIGLEAGATQIPGAIPAQDVTLALDAVRILGVLLTAIRIIPMPLEAWRFLDPSPLGLSYKKFNVIQHIISHKTNFVSPAYCSNEIYVSLAYPFENSCECRIKQYHQNEIDY